MKNAPAACLTDGYKTGHVFQYPENTSRVYSNWTPRKSLLGYTQEVVHVGVQYLLKEYLIDHWNKTFFNVPEDIAVNAYKRRLDNYLGKDVVAVDHIRALHKLEYLPVVIKAIPEGRSVQVRTAVLTIENTKPEFFWVTNYLETLMSSVLWLPSTSATIATELKKMLSYYAMTTGMDMSFVDYMAHDFSARGMVPEASALSGFGHLCAFKGTDTIAAIDFAEMYYNSDCEKEVIGTSVPATEHSVMCMGTKEAEIETFYRLITQIYPKGVISIVADTWNLWDVIKPGGYADHLKEHIINRDGKVVFRPDSGKPEHIVCGYRPDEIKAENEARKEKGKPALTKEEIAGAYDLLAQVFGTTVNEKGYKVLNPKVGLIYGDGITYEIARKICDRLIEKGYVPYIVFGIGSFTYQLKTRDSQGWAIKSTYGELSVWDDDSKSWNVEQREIYKDPITDTGMKKSARGLIRLVENNETKEYTMIDQCTREEEQNNNALEVIFKDGKMIKETSLSEIRKNIDISVDLYIKELVNGEA